MSHSGYWQLPCPTPLAVTCGGQHTEMFNQAATGDLIALYTTGPFHVMPGEVKVSLDGQDVGTFQAALPGGTVNPPLDLGTVTSGPHAITLQFSSSDNQLPASWGGFLDLFVKT